MQSFALNGLPAQSSDSVGLTLFDAFDATLGTLDSVDVAISGRIWGGVTFLPDAPPGLDPTYFYELSIVQLFDSLSFTFPPEALYTGVSNVALPLAVDVNYMHTFTIDSSGLAPVATTASASPGGTYTQPVFTFARLDYFERSGPAQIAILPHTIISARFPNASMKGALDSIGSITITYNFTSEAAAVSEPGTVLLLVAGLALVGVRRHRKSASGVTVPPSILT